MSKTADLSSPLNKQKINAELFIWKGTSFNAEREGKNI
jgi:hypothetical protein